MYSCSRANVNNFICLPDNFLLVFNYDDGISQIPEMHQGFHKPCTVSRMQTNAWFIENI